MNEMKMAATMHEIMSKSKGFHQNYVISYTLETNYIWIYWDFFPFYRSSIRELANLPGGRSCSSCLTSKSKMAAKRVTKMAEFYL